MAMSTAMPMTPASACSMSGLDGAICADRTRRRYRKANVVQARQSSAPASETKRAAYCPGEAKAVKAAEAELGNRNFSAHHNAAEPPKNGAPPMSAAETGP